MFSKRGAQLLRCNLLVIVLVRAAEQRFHPFRGAGRDLLDRHLSVFVLVKTL
jgi:hypothetical protein